jgi:hypothetical protein
MPLGASLTWQIVYNHHGAAALKLVKGKASAIDAACEIFDAGGGVCRIETAGGLATLNAEQLLRIWKERKAGRFG